MPLINLVQPDPFDANEEAYVAAHYCDGCKPELVATFYLAMRHWWLGPKIEPPHEGIDAQRHPDMWYAGKRAGIFAIGQVMIRTLIREYRGNQQHPAPAEA